MWLIGLRFEEKSVWEAPEETIQSWRSQVFNSSLLCQYNTCPIELSFIIKEGLKNRSLAVKNESEVVWEDHLEHVRIEL